MGQGPRPLHLPEGPRTLARTKGAEALFQATIRQAQERGLLPPRPRGAVAAPGLETRPLSRSFVWRQGKRPKRYGWPKLTRVVEIQSPLYLSAQVSKGPSQDSPPFRPAVRSAPTRCRLDTLLGASG